MEEDDPHHAGSALRLLEILRGGPNRGSLSFYNLSDLRQVHLRLDAVIEDPFLIRRIGTHLEMWKRVGGG